MTKLTAGLFVAALAIGYQDLPGATPDRGGFALPDRSGSRLILLPELAQPELLKTALCSGGRSLAIRFDRRQAALTNNGRQTSRNFDTLAGSVFTVAGGTVDTDATCFLASDRLLAGATPLTAGPPVAPGACARRDRFVALRNGRGVKNCWPIARLTSGPDIALVEFERVGRDALASVVVVDGSRTLFADQPAEFRGEGQDLWRADDGGVLSPDGFEIVGVVRRSDQFTLAMAWRGAEGRSLSLWTSTGGDRLTKVITDYWYQAPI